MTRYDDAITKMSLLLKERNGRISKDLWNKIIIILSFELFFAIVMGHK